MAKLLRSLNNHWDRAVMGLIMACLLGMAVVGPALYAVDPTKPNIKQKFGAPSAQLPMGADELGRDVLSRVISGSRVSLLAGIGVVIIGGLIGSVIGFAAGFYGGWIDFFLMRLTDLFLGFPALILAIAFAAAFGTGLWQGVLAAGLVWWPGFARLVRGQVLALVNLPYVEAARAIGCSDTRIVLRHILPGCIGEIMVKATMDLGLAILFIASLGFLGLGAQPPTPEWGTMVAEGRTYILDRWWISFFPGVAIAVAVIAFSLLGDVLQPVLSPHLKRRNLS